MSDENRERTKIRSPFYIKSKAVAPKMGTIKSLAKAAVFLVFWHESVKNDVYSKLFLTFCVYI